MTLRHYTIFQAVAKRGNFTKAAEQLYITQSAVSHTIRELEERTGAALFDRLPKGVRLTACGRLLLEEVTPLLAAGEALDARLSCLEREAPLRLVSSITIAAYWLPGLLRELQRKWPDTPVEVEVVSAANAVELLREGNADLALIEGTPPSGPFACSPFASYDLQAVCAPGYAPTGRTWTAQELCAQKLLLREPGSAIRDAVDSAFYLAGCIARPAWTSVNSQALIQAARAGLGVTVLPTLLVQEGLLEGALTALAVEGFPLQNRLWAVRRTERAVGAPLSSLLEQIKAL